jgi:hypothetical protein
MDCKSCGSDHQENFCPNCGEKEFNQGQLSIKHFVEETFEGFIHFDTKFFRTLKTLVAKPGQLSIEYTEGKRVKYMKPIQFFLIINLLFFIIMIGNNIYSLSLDNYVTYKPFTNYNSKQIVKEKLRETKLSYPVYRELFNEKMISNSKEFIFLYVPFYGLLFSAFLFWKKKYFVEHLVFATHFMAFVLLINIFFHYVINIPFYWFIATHYSQNADTMQTFDNIVSAVLSVMVAIYLSIAVRRFYKANILWGITVSLFIGATFFIFMQYYRMILFYKIIYLG